MNVLDVLLIVAAVWFALVGYRQGFVVGILSVLGFLGGGLIALLVLPLLWDQFTSGDRPGTGWAIAAVIIVIICASVGQALTTHLGNRLRQYITWTPARALDATGGAFVNVVAMLIVAWLIGSALAGTSLPTLGKEVRNSRVLLGVSHVMPQQANAWFDDFSAVLAKNGYPQVFSPFATEPIQDVPPPSPELAGSPVAERAKRSIVKGRRHGAELPEGGGGHRVRLLEGQGDDERARRGRRAAADGADRAARGGATAPVSCATTGSGTSRCWTFPS